VEKENEINLCLGMAFMSLYGKKRLMKIKVIYCEFKILAIA
jgi:hypothetical protein